MPFGLSGPKGGACVSVWSSGPGSGVECARPQASMHPFNGCHSVLARCATKALYLHAWLARLCIAYEQSRAARMLPLVVPQALWRSL